MKTDGDAVWTTALHWLLRVREAPEDVALAAELKQWLATDERHARAYRNAERVWQVTGDVGPAHEAEWRPTAPARRSGRYALVAMALAAVVTAISLAPSVWLSLRADHSTGTGEVETIPLADGSTAQLNAESALAVNYTSRREIELLAGEAFFDVKRDPQRPFVVRAADVAVSVRGTAFSVSRTNESVSVSVLRGSVWVSSTGLSPVVLHPGSRVAVSLTDGSRRKLDTVPLQSVAAWRAGRLIVNDAPVLEVIDELRRYIPGVVIVRGDDLEFRRVTGIFDIREPEGALASVVRPFGESVQAWTPYLRVVSPATTR